MSELMVYRKICLFSGDYWDDYANYDDCDNCKFVRVSTVLRKITVQTNTQRTQ